MSTPQTYTITSTATYSTTDGSERYYLTAGTVIPMSLAIAMGLTGAGYDDPVWFNENEQAAILDLIGDDWWETYDSRVAIAAGTVTANRLFLALIDQISPTTTTISHFNGTTVAGNCLAGLYTFDGSTFTRAAASASTAIAGVSTTQDVTLTTPYTRQADLRHYAAFITDSATAQVARLNAAGAPNGKGRKALFYDAGSLTLPASLAVGAVAGVATTIWQHGE